MPEQVGGDSSERDMSNCLFRPLPMDIHQKAGQTNIRSGLQNKMPLLLNVLQSLLCQRGSSGMLLQVYLFMLSKKRTLPDMSTAAFGTSRFHSPINTGIRGEARLVGESPDISLSSRTAVQYAKHALFPGRDCMFSLLVYLRSNMLHL